MTVVIIKLLNNCMHVSACVCVYECLCGCVFLLHHLSFPCQGNKALRSECKIDRADFAHLMSFLTSNLMEEALIQKP